MNTKSDVKILFGEEIGNDEQSLVKLELIASKNAAQEQVNQLKESIQNAAETDDALFFRFPCNEENAGRLEEILTGLFNGINETRMCKDLTKWSAAGLMKYDVINQGDKVVLIVRPGDAMEQTMKGQLQMILGMGADPILSSQTNKITLELKSKNTFHDIEQYMQETDNFVTSLLRSFLADLQLDFDEELLTKVGEIVKNIAPTEALDIIKFFKNVNMSLSFRSLDEVPDQIKKQLFSSSVKEGLAVSKNLKESEQGQWIEIEQLVESGFEMFLTCSLVGGVHLSTRLPGFGNHFIRNINKKEE